MADEQPQTIRAIHWRDVFPFLNLFRAFRVAIHPSKLVLGLLALLTIYAGGRILDGLWSWWAAPYQPIPGELDRYQEYSAAPDRAVAVHAGQEADHASPRNRRIRRSSPQQRPRQPTSRSPRRPPPITTTIRT